VTDQTREDQTMTTPSPDPTDQQPTVQEILERRDEDGKKVYDHARRDPFTGQWYGRRHDDHTREDRIA
jgi:hypothetical protein